MSASPSAVSRLFARPAPVLLAAILTALVLVVSTFAAGAGAAATLAAQRGGPLDITTSTLIATQLGVLTLLAIGVPVLAYWATVCWLAVPTETVGVGSALARSIGALPRLLLGGALVLAGAAGLTILSLALSPLWVLSPLVWIAVVVRRRRRGVRSGWRSLDRWAVALTPGGPVFYWLLAWSQWVPRVAVQGASPLAALRDSAADIRLRWVETARAVLPWVLFATVAIALVQLLALLGELWGWADAAVSAAAFVSLPVFLLATAPPTVAAAGTWLDRGGRPPRPRSTPGLRTLGLRGLGLRTRGPRLAALALVPLLVAGVVTLPPAPSATASEGAPVELLYVAAQPSGDRYVFTAAIRLEAATTGESAGIVRFTLDPDGPNSEVRDAYATPSNASAPWTIAVATWSRATPAYGTHTITAQFLGSEGLAPSGVLSEPFTIHPPAQEVDISWNPPSTWFLGQAPHVRAEVSGRSGGAPSGFVSLEGQIAGGSEIAHIARFELVPGDGAPSAVDIDLGLLPLGTHNLSLRFEGSSGFIESATLFQLVTVRDPASVLTTTTQFTLDGGAAPRVLTFGEQATLFARLASSEGVPLANVAGTITFFDDAVALGTVAVENGAASLTVALDTLGAREYRAEFSPADIDVLASTSDPVSASVRRGVHSSISAPAVVNGAATFAVAIALSQRSGPDVDAPPPSGVIELRERLHLGDGAVTRTVSLEDGSAQFTLPAEHLGTREVGWRYAGDVNYVAIEGRVGLEVHDTTTTTVLELNTDDVAYGGTLGLEVRVSASDSVLVPDGQVRLEQRRAEAGDGSPVVLGIRSLTAGAAQFSVPVPTPGLHALVAVYVPAAGHSPSSSAPEALTVPMAAATVTSDAVASSYGTTFELVARVRIATTGGIADGRVTFRDPDGNVLPDGDGVQLDDDGVARVMVDGTRFEPGTTLVRVEYLGTAQWSSTQTTVAVEIARATPVVSWEPRAAIGYGEAPVSEIALAAGGVVPADGTIVSLVASDSFGWVVRGQAVLASGTGVIVWERLLTPEEWTVRATTVGDTRFVPLEANFTTVVSAVATRIELGTPSATTVAYGTPFHLTAVVHSIDWSESPTGRVVFRVGGTELGTIDLEPAGGGSSLAQLDAPFLASLGTRPIEVSYEPDQGRFGESALTGPVVTMVAAVPQVTLSLTPAGFGERVGVQASVTLPGLSEPLARGTIRFTASGANGPVASTVELVDGVAVLPNGVLVAAAGELTVQAAFRSSDERWRDVDDSEPAATAVSTLIIERGAAIVSASAPARVTYGDTLTVTVHVAGPVGPSGSVQLVDVDTETAIGGAVSLTGGVATIAPGAAALAGQLGERLYEVRYSGDSNLTAARSIEFAVRVDPAPTALTAWATGQAVNGIFVQETGDYVAQVQTTAGLVPTGTVSWLRSGEVLGTSAVDATGIARLSLTPTEAWEGALEVVFTSADAARFAPSSTAFGAAWRVAPVVIGVAPLWSGTINRAIPVTADLYSAYSGPGRSPLAALSGEVEFLASTGESCRSEVRAAGFGHATASCVLEIASPGTRSLTVRYSGGGAYLAAEANSQLQVARGVSIVEFHARPTVDWVGLATTDLDWRVVGPTATQAEGAVVVRRNGLEICRSSALSDSCSYTFDARDVQATFSLSYAGDTHWMPTTAQLAGPVVPCLAPPQISVAQQLGTATLTTPLHCGRAGEPAIGVKRGTLLSYRIDAKPGYEAVSFAGYLQGTPGGATVSFPLHYGDVEWGEVTLAPACVPLDITNAVVISGLCTTRTGHAGLRHGSLAEVEARTPGGVGDVQFSGWTASADGFDLRAPRQQVRMWATGERFIIAAGFAPACYPVTVATGRDVALETSQTDCTIFATGAPGHRVGSSLLITSTGGFGFSPLPPTVTLPSGDAVASFPVSSAPVSRVDRVEVTGPLTIGATSTRCVPLTVVTEGAAYGSLTLLDSGDCVLGDGWYVPGSRVEYSTSRPDNRMSSHAVEGTLSLVTGEPGPRAMRRYIQLGEEGGTLTARFANESCVDVTVEVKPAGAAQYRVMGDRESNGCLPGMYDASGGASFTVEAVTLPVFTDAMVGITGLSYTGGGAAILQFEKSLGSTEPSSRLVVTKSTQGSVKLTVWVCQRLEVSTRVVNPWGTAVTDSAVASARELVAVSLAPDCPLAGGSYLIGDEVLLMNAADPRGFAFTRWSGASAGAETVQQLVMDGVSSKRLVAEYTATCYRLKTRLDEATVGIDPTCPGRSDLWFAGGTYVPLAASGTSGTFEGWFAPDPRDLYAQEGSYALVEMTEDREVYASYRGDRWYDGAVGFFEDAGDVLAMFAKQGLGAAAQGFKYVAQEVPPFSFAKKAVMGIGLVGEGLAQLLELAGVDAPWLGDLRSVLGGIDEVWALAWSPLDCVTVWSVGGNGGAAAAQQSWAAQMVSQVNVARKAQQAAQLASAGGPNGARDLLTLAGATYALYGQAGPDAYRTLAQRVLASGTSSAAEVIALMDQAGIYYETPEQASQVANGILKEIATGKITTSVSAGNVVALADLAQGMVENTKEYRAVKMLVDVASGDASWADAASLMNLYLGTGTELAGLNRAYGVGEAFVSAMVNADWTQPASQTFSTTAFVDSFSTCMGDSMPGFFGIPR